MCRRHSMKERVPMIGPMSPIPILWANSSKLAPSTQFIDKKPKPVLSSSPVENPTDQYRLIEPLILAPGWTKLQK
jgi:hypothetical protein